MQFGPFTLAPARRALLRDGRLVPLGSRAADILIFLAAHAGELKTNAEIVRHVWPDTFVEEANLRVHISALRKALDDIQKEPKFIANVPGRGYAFIAELVARPTENAAPVPVLAGVAVTPRIFGREHSIMEIAAQLARSRLLTIVGPGGIGKSTVARAVAAGAESTVWIDLSDVAQPGLIATSIATSLGILTRSDDVVRDIAVHLAQHDMLVVLDGCEQVVDGVAVIVEAIMARAPALRVLATSREPLRAEGERVHRLPPLDLPAQTGLAEEAMRSPAVQLFVERADACLGRYVLTDADTPHVAKICAQLDGIALAIELAAGRLETISVPALAAALTDCFRLLTRGRRTALPRHQTLRATLDWSYNILSERERMALAELSVLRGCFSEAAGAAVLSGGEAGDDLASLVAKSLVAADTQPAGTRYRLLDTTRLYAAEKLAAAGSTDASMGRLAAWLAAWLVQNEQQLYSAAMVEWPEEFSAHVPSLRDALDWAFSESGNPSLGVRLTVASLPLFFRLSLLDECLAVVTRAIAYLEARPGFDERSRMKLNAALGWPQMRATDAPEHGIAAWSTTLRIAETIGDTDHQLRAIWALWVDAINRAEPRIGLQFAERFAVLAKISVDPADAIIGHRMHGATLHWLGRHAEARDELRQMLRDYTDLRGGQHSIRFQFDQHVTARIVLARALWFLGQEGAALLEVQETIDYAKSIRHTLSLSNVLAEAACPLALLSGRDDLATGYIAELREHTRALSLDVWHAYADCFEAERLLQRGETQACLRQLRPAMATLQGAGFTLFQTYFQSLAAVALSRQCRHPEAFSTIAAAIDHCQASGERWCLPELHRVRAELLLAEGLKGAAGAAWTDLGLATAVAAQDGALGWARRIERDLGSLDACKVLPAAG
ncbi:winged helix-turn-helix domain-containing protein [Sinorhizobium sp. RAC02]|uniref:ATP-binding protein n=1 Tax=Sinorhizobium sp. RAC02 TaxID=1842534 RepID=UPI00083DEBFE|nr:winged helix-turn-helix domain-containing protein [Sinorhizobium sp. RAC02]